MNDKNNDVDTAKPRAFWLRLWRGEISLVITYWVFGVCVRGLLSVAVTLMLLRNWPRLVVWGNGPWAYWAIWSIAVIADLYFLVAIWRSAGNYTGPRHWRRLAQLAVLLALIQLPVGIYRGVHNVSLPRNIELLNQGLPAMIDNDTRLDKLVLIDDELHAIFTLPRLRVDDLDLDILEHALADLHRRLICTDTEMLALLEQVREMIFDYRDKNNRPIVSLHIDKVDCRAFNAPKPSAPKTDGAFFAAVSTALAPPG